ncbi:MAG: hypothetical protein Q7U91_16200 [Sideroxyarcus sp.]|nr:hypothetical protein [Sideroxyarcus sp.]
MSGSSTTSLPGSSMRACRAMSGGATTTMGRPLANPRRTVLSITENSPRACPLVGVWLSASGPPALLSVGSAKMMRVGWWFMI